MLVEEAAPFIVQLRAISLQRVGDLHSGPGILLLQLDRLAEEVHSHQRRLAALPGEVHLTRRLGVVLDVLAGEPFEHLRGHPETLRFREQFLFAEVEAVGAIEVAYRPDGLDHDVERQSG